MIDFTKFIRQWRRRVWLRLFPEEMAAEYAMQGSDLTLEQVAELEERLSKNPNDFRSRAMLLGKYFTQRGIAARVQHIEWVIRHYPEHPFAGLPYVQLDHILDPEQHQRIKTVWEEQITQNPLSPAVLTNAAHFLYFSEKELAEQLLLLAVKLKPTDNELRHTLSHFYSLWKGHEDQAFAEAEKVYKATVGDSFYELTNLPSRAFKAGKFDQASASATNLLEAAKQHRKDWNYGNAINTAHTILGQVALMQGDIEKAKFHLDQSAHDIASPQTRSFGPSLDLAKALAHVEEKAAVLEYLDRFELLCGVGNDRAFQLRYKVETGTEPKNKAEHEEYEVACLEHQFKALQARSAADRKEHLERAIEQNQCHLEIWLDRTGAETEERSLDVDRKVKGLQAHLARLQSLSAPSR